MDNSLGAVSDSDKTFDDAQKDNAFWTTVNEGLAYAGRMFDKVTGVPMAVGEPVLGGVQAAYTMNDIKLRRDYDRAVNNLALDNYDNDPAYHNMQSKIDWDAITQKYGDNGFDKARTEIYQILMNNK